MKRLAIFFVAVLGMLGLLAACSAPISEPAGSADEPAKLRLPMGYIPDPQYAPLYVAVEKGYFAEEGIELTFDYSFETDGMALVGANEVPFALVGGDQVILARAQGLPVVYVMEWFQKYPIAIVSREAAGIKTPQDLIGRTVGLPGFFGTSYVGYVGLLSANGINQDQVEAVDIGFTQIENLLSDQVEAVVVFANNEPIQLANMGEAINTLQVSDYIDLVHNGVVTNEETLANDPKLVERFLRAFLRGLADTLADPDEAYELSKQYVEGLDDSRRDVLQASLDFWRADTLGETDAQAWQRTQDLLVEMKLLDGPLADLDEAYTNAFIEKVQPE
ncbi:MAG: ABC transporter substrate-binding protein [Candidatus Promineifilaceae bacterium]